MGAYTMDGMITPKYESVIVKDIVCPTIAGLSEEGIPYTGFLYFGLMLTASGPVVLEYNCRLGDPETQPIMMRMDFVFLAVAFDAVASRTLDRIKPAWKPGASVRVGDGVGETQVPSKRKKNYGIGGSGGAAGRGRVSCGNEARRRFHRDQRRARARRNGRGRFSPAGNSQSLRSR